MHITHAHTHTHTNTCIGVDGNFVVTAEVMFGEATTTRFIVSLHLIIHILTFDITSKRSEQH